MMIKTLSLFAALCFTLPCAAAAAPDHDQSFRLVQTAEVPYGQVCRYENAASEGYALALDKSGRVLSSTPYRANKQGSETVSSFAAETEQTDVYGNKVSVVTDLTDGVYTLADPLRNIYVYHAHNGTGQFPTDDMRYHNTTGVFNDQIAITSYLNLIKVYDFYADGGIGVPLRGVDGSHDELEGNYRENNESRIFLFIHYGVNEQNAHGWFDDWYNAAMLGVGDGKSDGYFYQLGRAADVMAHEYQHAITHFRVDFTQMNESGAIDEAISDMIGALAEGHELTDERFWNMGEDAEGERKGGVRSIKEPSNGYRSSFDDLFPACHEKHNHNVEGCDFGGVHYNSTILTHAQYLMWKDMPDYFTKERIGELWYSLIPLLGKDATFEDFKAAFVQTAENLGFERSALNVIRKHLGMETLPAQYTVTFLNEDGTRLYQTTVSEGETAVYGGETPALPATAQYEYTFAGWDGALENITGDVTVKATYRQTLRSYPIQFYSKGLLYEEKVLPYGEAVPLPAPEREGYVFGGWYLDEKLSEKAENLTVSGELHLYAKWEKTGGCAGALSPFLLLPLLAAPLLLKPVKARRSRRAEKRAK